MKARFKDKALNTEYQSLVGNTPEQISARQIRGAALSSFKLGYEGYPLPHFIVKNTFVYAAYIAGKESRVK